MVPRGMSAVVPCSAASASASHASTSSPLPFGGDADAAIEAADTAIVRCESARVETPWDGEVPLCRNTLRGGRGIALCRG